MASGSPRKRRMGRLFDKMYGNDTRGSHYSSQMYASRSVAEQTTDLNAYVISGSSAYLTSSMNFSSSAANKAYVVIDGLSSLYNDGTGSYGFAAWVKMSTASAPSPVGFFSFGGDAGGSKFFSFGLETSGSGYQLQNQHNSGSGSNVSASMTSLSFSAGTWQFVSYTEKRTGANRIYTASLNASTFASGTWTAFSGTFNSSSLGVIRSGSTPGGGVNAMIGLMHQAAFWNTARTVAQFKSVYNSGVSDNWKKHAPTYYWSLGVSDGTTVDAMTGTVAGTVVSATLSVGSP